MLKGVNIIDRIKLKSERELTDAGQLIVPCAFARTGAQVYTAGQLGLSGVEASKLVTVMRDEADVFDEASMSTFRSAPVTIGHPKAEDGSPLSVSSENSKDLQVGTLEGMPTRDEDTLVGTLVIARQDAIDIIDDGTKELSAGYTCDLELVDVEGGDPVLHQRNIRANHIAIVERGRAGASCSIADEALEGADVLTSDELLNAMTAPSEAPVELEDKVVVEDKAEDKASVEDEAALAQVKLEDELTAAQASVATLNDELAASKVAVAELQDQLDTAVEERVQCILIAKDLTDVEDFSGKSLQEIKLLVLKDKMPDLDLTGKSEAYVCARFDVLAEDAEIGETPMGKLLKDNAEHVHEEVKQSTIVEDARARSVERGKKRSS